MALCWKLQPFVSCERLEVLVSTFQYTLLQGLLSDVPVLHLVPVHCKGLNMQLVRFGSLLLQHLSLYIYVSDNLWNVMQLSLCLIKKPAKVIYAVKAHAVVVTSVMLGGVVLLLYKVISGADIVLQVRSHASRQACCLSMCLNTGCLYRP